MQATLQCFTERTQLKAYARQLGRNFLLLVIALSGLFERAPARPLLGTKQTFPATTQMMPIYEYTP